jgi:hypothetical protein
MFMPNNASVYSAEIMPTAAGGFGREFEISPGITLLPATSGFIPRRDGKGWFNLRMEPVALQWFNKAVVRPAGDRAWSWVTAASPLTTIIAAVSGGANVVVTDSNPEGLQFIRQQVPRDYQDNLRTELASAVHTSLYDGTIGTILCTGTLNYLDPDQCDALTKKMFAVAAPGCELFVETMSYRTARVKRFIRDFETREAAGDRYPGWGVNVAEGTRGKIRVPLHNFNPSVLRARVADAGWKVTHCDWSHKDYKFWIGHDGQEFVALHAKKP